MFQQVASEGTSNKIPIQDNLPSSEICYEIKYPRLRSAFTYWEDKPYSRIDLGKAKYGGPFITEQVEDVKTFFRVLGIAVVYSLLVGLSNFMHGTYTQVNVFDYNKDSTLERCNDAIGSLYMSICYKTVLV